MTYEPFFEKYQRLVDAQKKHLRFLGLLSKGDLGHFYAPLDAFVISSRSECFALTQIEAVQQRVPIVVTDIPGARMLVKSSGFGKVVAPEDPYALAQGIIEVIKQKKRLAANHAKALQFLKKYENFRIDQ